MTDWITDRPPTEADGDRDGDIDVQRCPESEQSVSLHWSYVGPGVPWMHSDWWDDSAQPEPEPEPPAKPDFKPGQVWRSRSGMICEIIAIIDDPTDIYNVHSNFCGGHWHSLNGKSCMTGSDGPDHDADLVELIRENSLDPKPEPKPLNPEAITTIPRRFATLTRTEHRDGRSTFYATDDDENAWWMVFGETGWQQLPPLPRREVPANA